MRRFILASAFSVALVGTAGAQFWDPPAVADRNGSQGFDFYMLEVPDANSMMMDGSSDDWGWCEPEFTLTHDEWRDEGDRPAPDRADLNVTTFMGWKGGDVNRWYVFLEATDDVLAHAGTAIARWDGDMLQVGLDPQDHGRERSPASGYTMEWLMAPGDLSPPPNVAFRYTEQEAWAEYGEAPWVDFAVPVDPQEAWAADLWTDGGTTVYEFSIKVLAFQEDGGPSVSEEWQLDAVAGEDGSGLPFAMWYEDGEGPDSSFSPNDDGTPGGRNDWTTRGPEASARQYFSIAKLLRLGEFDSPTAVESSTWGQIKGSF